MKHSPLKWTILLILTSCLPEEILAENDCKIELTLFNICVFMMKISLSASQSFNITQLLNTGIHDIRNASNEENDHTFKYGPTSVELNNNISQSNISKFVIPLISLYELEQQEKHQRKKKSVPKKKVPIHEMRNKLKQLMTNISNTFNDMDWYFALEQLENQTSDVAAISSPRKKMKKHGVRKMNKVDEQNSDGFLDQFIQQMYEINPVFIDKIRSRIDQEISSNKRRIRLAPPSGDNFKVTNSKTENPFVQSKQLIPQRREIVKSVQLKDLIPSYNEKEDYYYSESNLGPDCFYNTSKSEKKESFSSEKKSENNKRRNSAFSDEDLSFDSSDFTTTTLSTTTLETFYDLGDYYKENDEDYEGNLEMKDIEEYEINKDILETSTVNLIDDSCRVNKKISRSTGKETRYKQLKERSRIRNYPRKLSCK